MEVRSCSARQDDASSLRWDGLPARSSHSELTQPLAASIMSSRLVQIQEDSAEKQRVVLIRASLMHGSAHGGMSEMDSVEAAAMRATARMVRFIVLVIKSMLYRLSKASADMLDSKRLQLRERAAVAVYSQQFPEENQGSSSWLFDQG